MFNIRLFSVFTTGALLITVVILSNPIACSSSSSDGSGDTRLTVSNLGKNISLSSGEVREISSAVKFDVNRYGGPFSSVKIDLNAHLSAISIAAPNVTGLNIPFPLEFVKPANAAITGSQMFVRIGRAEQQTSVCSEGEQYGPFDITLNDNLQPASVSPATAQATQSTLDIINIGGYSFCVQIIPVITAIADLNSLVVDFGSCNEPAANIQGSWTGPYSCTGTCPESGNVTVEITQDQNDPSIASYTDLQATYQGRICGNRFSYAGGVASSYDESGTFILNADGSASKTSNYKDISGSCSGTCTDTLVRQ